jgi:beta-lactam-binding protein with PASTA domain
MKPLFRFAMMALVLVVVALVSALTAMRFAIHGQEVEVPAIVGKTPAEAERVVAGLGLQIEVERQYYSPQIPEGRIMTQMPPPGTKVRRGWAVRVARSLGPQRVVIPDVTKQSERAAEWNIQRRGLEVASTAEMQLPGTPADKVLAQSPPANASQVEAPRTSLLVTVTADPPAYVMPSFVGQPLGTASRALQDAGFRLGNVSMAPLAATSAASDSIPATPSLPPAQPSPASMIVAQTPPAGQKVLVGAVVNLEVR